MDTMVFTSDRSDLLPHPLYSGVCKVINFASDKELTVTFSSCSSALRYEPDIYLRTRYEWLHSLASFSLLNIETSRRTVIFYYVYLLSYYSFKFIYVILSVLSHVVSADAIVMFRSYLSSLSLMALRSIMLKLLEFITDLGMVPSHFLEAETPSLVLLQFLYHCWLRST